MNDRNNKRVSNEQVEALHAACEGVLELSLPGRKMTDAKARVGDFASTILMLITEHVGRNSSLSAEDATIDSELDAIEASAKECRLEDPYADKPVLISNESRVSLSTAAALRFVACVRQAQTR